MITAGPLEDARHFAQHYSRMRQEAEAQAAELSKRQARVRESPVPENIAKWEAAEAKMRELKANMAVLGKEASAALAAVEAQQQRLTFQRLVSLVEGEKNYHLRIGAIPLENGPLGSALLLSLCHDPRGDKKKILHTRWIPRVH